LEWIRKETEKNVLPWLWARNFSFTIETWKVRKKIGLISQVYCKFLSQEPVTLFYIYHSNKQEAGHIIMSQYVSIQPFVLIRAVQRNGTIRRQINKLDRQLFF
jgi:hypothetical protein